MSGVEIIYSDNSRRPTEWEVLEELEGQMKAFERTGYKDYEWCRPMDIGGTDGSTHSQILAKLIKKELAVKKAWGGYARGSNRYQISPKGRTLVATAKGERK